MPVIDITLSLNGRAVQWSVQPGETLLEALHAQHLKGTKLICGTGDCCGCGVILNGRSINSCCTLAAQADGAELGRVDEIRPAVIRPVEREPCEARDGLHFAERGEPAPHCGPGTRTTASRATSATAMSEGCVAMHAWEVPRMASSR